VRTVTLVLVIQLSFVADGIAEDLNFRKIISRDQIFLAVGTIDSVDITSIRTRRPDSLTVPCILGVHG
jgi:hypothetical protein